MHCLSWSQLFFQGASVFSFHRCSYHLQWFCSPRNKVCHYFHCFPIYLPWSDGTRCHDLSFWMLSFKPVFSRSFTLIKRVQLSIHWHTHKLRSTSLQFWPALKFFFLKCTLLIWVHGYNCIHYVAETRSPVDQKTIVFFFLLRLQAHYVGNVFLLHMNEI